MRRTCKTLCPRAVVLVLLAAAGCGDNGPKIVPVTGVLSYNGKPVTNAYIDFLPEKGRPSWGETDEQGRFSLNYDREHTGAVVGKHKVHVRLRPTTVEEQQAVMDGKKPALSKDMAEFFDKYGEEKSTVEVVINTSTRELNFDWK